MKKNSFLYYVLVALFLSPAICLFGVIFFVIFSVIFPSSPNKNEAIELTAIISHDYLPESFELVYSKQYMEVLSSNMCFVFHYPDGYYPASKSKFNYLNQNPNLDNEDFLFDFRREVESKEGCAKFISKLNNEDAKLFTDHGFHHEYGRGSKIFINDQDNLIMFEGYIYD
ncbi:hypothetical protein C7B62_03270 [Pleurocapsa sp. CCALA 161]|uniref:hypothetical protein n=1 Tax=Pleurocapsa sp. CCALA 161 TaxID=2107688 RepID=UPI000D07EE85|nr:hypothetical protein [Pleurocapsa sp. CCALA 161]PSB12089.1 hypothetical protein C7B62_03270 [Pleurocapsa sp. CCALA 161]